MNNFQLSSNIDTNKVFLIHRSSLKKRWDPKMLLFNQEYAESPYGIVTLGSLLQSSPQYGANERGVERTSRNQPRYIRITDIDSSGGLSDDIGVTAENCDIQYFLNNNDLLIARSGNTVGKSYIHISDENSEEKFLFAGYMIRFIVNSNIALPYYIFVFTQLSMYKKWVNAIQRTAGQPNINAEEYKSLELPLPPLTLQKNIVDKYHISLDVKQQKEQEAQALLDSIDDYLMEELGIELPEIKLDLEDRVFKINSKEIINRRIDPFAYLSKFKKIKEAIINSKYLAVPLKNLIKNTCNGEWGDDPDNLQNSDEQYMICTTIRGTDFDVYNLNLRDNNIRKRGILKERLAKLEIKEFDFLVEKSGGSENQPVGRIALITPEILDSQNICFSNFLQKFTVDSNIINPYYLFYYLRFTYNINITENMQSQTSGIRNLITKEYFDQKVIVPSVEKQNEIVSHIQSIRNKAEKLQKEAHQQLEDTKKEIERMILGESQE